MIRHDPTVEASPHSEPALLKPGVTLQEEELILCKTEKGDQAWSLAEVHKVYPEEIEVVYYTTPRQQLEDYNWYERRQRHSKGTLSQEPTTQIVDREAANERVRGLNPSYRD